MTSMEINSEDEYRLETRNWLAENIDLIEEKQPFSTLHWMPSREREDQHHLDCQKRQKSSMTLAMQELQSQQNMEAMGENHGCSVSSERKQPDIKSILDSLIQSFQ